ncbi:hypothetical protein NDU88_001119 [Pleurodeles waltl]|uniref:Uncharacterized protein n=1 Tax=Pleurodeles waltl TaxID=8319 RepID=A0AAV7UTT1_PLEWA|nr:hypothetical protein NDU88_001119 [Pleurodeles waltl]
MSAAQWPTVIRFLHYRDRDMVLKEIRSLAEVRVDTRLRVVADGTMHFFATPEEAWHWTENPDSGAAHRMRSVPLGGRGSR